MSEQQKIVIEGDDSSNVEEVPIFLPSNKGKQQKCYYANYEFRYENKYTDIIYWKCAKYLATRCSVRLRTKKGRVTNIIGKHLHAPDGRILEKKILMTRLKDLSNTSHLPRRAVVQTVCSEIKSVATTSVLPTSTTMMSNVSRIRSKGKKNVNPKSVLELTIDNFYRTTCTGGDFLFYDSGASEDRIIIFMSERCARFLSQCQVWQIDGTFDVSPPIFNQLYTIHGQIDNFCVPLAYVLCSDKKQKSYIEIFNRMKNAYNYKMNPLHIVSDFEQAVLSTVKEIFPSANHQGCHFHFAQCVYRAVQKCGMQVLYVNNPDIAVEVNKLISLAFVPPDDVAEVYETVIECGIFADQSFVAKNNLQKLLDYYDETWIGERGRIVVSQRKKAKFPISSWNVYHAVLEGRNRTNNTVEAWHNAIRTCVNKAPQIFKFIEFLQKEESLSFLRLSQFEEAGRNPPKRKKYANNDDTIKKIVSKYSEYTDKNLYLQHLSKLVHVPA